MDITLDGENKSFSSKIRNKTRMPLSPLLSNEVLEVLARAILQAKEMRGIQIRNEEVKWSFFSDDMILYIENPKCVSEK